mgnify:FL=1
MFTYKQMQKSFITSLLIFAFCAVMPAVAANAMRQVLVVTTKDAGKVMYYLDDKPVITFTDTEVVLKTDKATVSYPVEEHVNMLITEYDPTNITCIEGVQAAFSISDDRIHVSNASPGTAVTVYTIDGRLVQKTSINEQGDAAISVATENVYIVRVGKFATKIRL